MGMEHKQKRTVRYFVQYQVRPDQGWIDYDEMPNCHSLDIPTPYKLRAEAKSVARRLREQRIGKRRGQSRRYRVLKRITIDEIV